MRICKKSPVHSSNQEVELLQIWSCTICDFHICHFVAFMGQSVTPPPLFPWNFSDNESSPPNLENKWGGEEEEPIFFIYLKYAFASTFHLLSLTRIRMSGRDKKRLSYHHMIGRLSSSWTSQHPEGWFLYIRHVSAPIHQEEALSNISSPPHTHKKAAKFFFS